MSGKLETKEEKQEVIFRHTAGQANRFATNFDSYFTRVMGRGNYGGSAVGECYETASRIVDGDFQSFADAWEVTAKRVEAIGRDCLKNGHKVSARDAFLPPQPTGAPRRCTPAPPMRAVAHHTRKSGHVSARPLNFLILNLKL